MAEFLLGSVFVVVVVEPHAAAARVLRTGLSRAHEVGQECMRARSFERERGLRGQGRQGIG